MKDALLPDISGEYGKRARDLAALLDQSRDGDDQFRIIAVAGVSGAGKTSLAKKLASSMGDAQVLHIDSYLTPKSLARYDPNNFLNIYTNKFTPKIEGLDTTAWDIPSLSRDINSIAGGQAVRTPYYDSVSQESLPGSVLVEPKKDLIIEGALSFHLSQIAPAWTERVLIKAPFHDRFIRKLIRSTKVNERSNLNYSISRYIEGSELAWQFYKECLTDKADIIINNTSNPQKDYSNISPIDVVDPLSEERTLRPIKTSGPPHEGESLRIGRDGSSMGAWVLRYLINDNVIFSSEISRRNLERVLGYYEFED